MNSGGQRRLAAIVFADIAGFTRQLHADEPKGLIQRRDVEQVVKGCVLGHRGRLVKSIGDAFMAEFGSAVDAVSAALEIQKALRGFPAFATAEGPVLVRIGLHTGDVVEEDGDLYGNAVNIAQRVQTMAPPGGICVTREVLSHIKPILKLQWTQVHWESTKPLPEPVDVFQLMGQGENINVVGAAAFEPSPAPRSYAVWILLALLVPVAFLFFNGPSDNQPVAQPVVAKVANPSPAAPAPNLSAPESLWSDEIAAMDVSEENKTKAQQPISATAEIPLLAAIDKLAAICGMHLLFDPALRTGADAVIGTNVFWLPPATNTVSLSGMRDLPPQKVLLAIATVHDLRIYQTARSQVWRISYARSRTPNYWRATYDTWKASPRHPGEAASPPAESKDLSSLNENRPLMDLIIYLARESKVPIVIDPKLKTGGEIAVGTNIISFAPSTNSIAANIYSTESLRLFLSNVPPREILFELVEINGLSLTEDPAFKLWVLSYKYPK